MADIDLILAEFKEIKEMVSKAPAAVTSPPAEILTAEQVAKKLSISKRTLTDWIKKKKIPVIRIGGISRFNWVTVVSHLESKTRA